MRGEIVQEKFPFGGAPELFALVRVETDEMCGDEVELAVELRQWPESFHARDDARNLEQLC